MSEEIQEIKNAWKNHKLKNKLHLNKSEQMVYMETSKPKKKVHLVNMIPVTKYFREYCEHSTLHGLRYLGEKNTSIFERLCWLCFLGLSLVACVYLIRQTWIKWESSPVLVTFSGNTLTVTDVPFPAVTICTELKVNNSKFNLTEIRERLYNITDDEHRILSTLSLICNGLRTTKIYNRTDEENIKFLVEVGIPCNRLIQSCSWQFKREDDCKKIIFPFLTEEGVCCTFNMLSPKDMYTDKTIIYNLDTLNQWKTMQNWTLETGYNRKISFLEERQIYPHRSLGTGFQSGLGLIIVADLNDMDKTCGSPEMGFKMALHNPAERPSMKQKYFKLPDNRELVVALKPSMLTTLENLRSYHPTKRGCFFPDEKKLQYFKYYTQDNCEFECKVNLTLRMCGCVTFYMPRDENTVYCGPRQWRCVKNISKVVRLRRAFLNIDDSLAIPKEVQSQLNKCNECLPACTEIQYDVQTSHSAFDISSLVNFSTNRYSVTKVSLFFKDMQFIPKHRTELYGWTDFLANCGGILGFCLGFSILSLIEIVYFVTIRLASKIGRNISSTKVVPH